MSGRFESRRMPGIRHWTSSNGQFRFRCASPRVAIADAGMPLEYRVRCFELKANGDRGPEAVVNCRMAP
ncbi:MAG: hypothetical protein ABFE08_19010 [Armatimonadia bacterium]